MSETIIREYHGFERAVDLIRDAEDLFDLNIPGEYQGTIKVIIEYIPYKESNK